MSTGEVPFLARAAVLDRFVHSSCPERDPDALVVILEVLRTKPELRSYFFHARPHPAWAPILWEQGFLATPPSPLRTEQSVQFPVWDVQAYLVSVARQVPEIVVKHVEAIEGHPWYVAQAIRALCYVPGKAAERILPRVLRWLDEPTTAPTIVQDACLLIRSLAKAECTDAAFELFSALAAPVFTSRYESLPTFPGRYEPIAILYGRVLGEKDRPAPELCLLEKLDVRRVVLTLEEHLRTALTMEAEVLEQPAFAFSSGWRTAIEDTDQQVLGSAKDDLLRGLRHALEAWAERSPCEAEEVLRRYLADDCRILRRLALHTLWRLPHLYTELVARELTDCENLDDLESHHEMFLLLQHGYPHLTNASQRMLVELIKQGPPPDKVQQLASWVKERWGEDPDQYQKRYRAHWVRDRLWMIREHLDSHTKHVLTNIIDGYGSPEDPAFTSRVSAYWVHDVSPLGQDELAALAPQQLAEFIANWEPTGMDDWGPERLSRAGLAEAVAELVLSDPRKYAQHLAPIARCGPEYAGALIGALPGRASVSSAEWHLWIHLFEELLADGAIRNDATYGYEPGWPSVRVSIATSIQVGLVRKSHAIPQGLMHRTKQLLFTLMDDLDPLPQHDRPAGGWVGHNDPQTVALNSVRPLAVRCLIEYARFQALAAQGGGQPRPGASVERRLEPDVRDALSRKLDKPQDPSRAVHSVFGQYLRVLYWLDANWVQSCIDRIFPEDEDEESKWFFAAAWDAFVSLNPYRPYLIDILRSKYERSIENLAHGYVTTSMLDPVSGLAMHLMWEYLLSSGELCAQEGDSLLARFLRVAAPEARASCAWACWRLCDEEKFDLPRHWAKIRALIEWRIREASLANHSSDYDDEMDHFAHLLPVAAKIETIRNLWPILEGLLPHVTRSAHHRGGWNTVVTYLSEEVAKDPVRSIQLYGLMCDLRTDPEQWLYHDDAERGILEVAAAHSSSRGDALAVIDSLARRGDYTFRDIYDRYS